MRTFIFLSSSVCLLLSAATLAGHAQTNTNANTNAAAPGGGATNSNRITRADVEAAEKILGLSFSDQQNDALARSLGNQRRTLQDIRKFTLSNSVPSAMLFNPLPVGFKLESGPSHFVLPAPPAVKMPANMDDLAFYSVVELGVLIKSRQLTSEQLTKFYLERLKKYGPKLLCVVTLTEDLALEQAKQADKEIAAGKYRGPLHGIPYGAKDLLATRNIRTTWGSAPYKDQVIDEDATVIKKLQEAGAVLVAKLSMGELAMGDLWYAGTTKNPWNPKVGSSGSSAGPGAATAAGLVGFSIGTETHGSIVSPSTVCGVSGLRPTYGRVSRTGAMSLTASMDKIGPMCRTIEDCAIVLSAICGPDGVDQTLLDVPFNYDSNVKLKDLRIGYLKRDFDRERNGAGKTNDLAALEKLRELGAQLVPVDLPTNFPLNDIELCVSLEAAAAFDELTLSGRDALMTNTWPGTFRQARFVPAVEYIQVNRIRYLLIQEMAKVFKDIDVFVSPSLSPGECNLLTNETGYPCAVVPDGFNPTQGLPTSVSFIGNLFGEGKMVAVAKAFQEGTDFYKQHPDLKKLDAL